MMKNSLLILFFSVAIAGCDTAFVRDLSGKKVTLLSPVNNLVTTDSIQTFYWDKLNDAFEYRLQVVSPRFDSIVTLIEDTTIFSDRFIIKLKRGIYQWRVRALNSASISDEGDTWKLTIQ